MMNRTAEALFWIGRYMERIENHTRLIDVNYHMRDEWNDRDGDEYMWERLAGTIGDLSLFKRRYADVTEMAVLHFLIFDQEHNNSIFSCIRQARQNIRSLRQLLPGELWEIANAFYLWMGEENMDKVMLQSPHMFYQRVREWVALFNGAAESMMVREREWYFIQSGKHLERTENTLRVLYSVYTALKREGSALTAGEVYNRMLILLKSVSGYEAFRKFHADKVTCPKVTKFVMLNVRFPRSVTFSLSSLETALQAIQTEDCQFESLLHDSAAIAATLREMLVLCNNKLPQDDILTAVGSMLALCDQLGSTISKTFFQEEFVEA